MDKLPMQCIIPLLVMGAVIAFIFYCIIVVGTRYDNDDE